MGVAEPFDSEMPDKKVWNAQATQLEQDDDTGKSAQANAYRYTQTLDLGLWNAEVTYGRPMFWIAPPTGNTPASGGALIAKLSDNEFLVTAYRARVSFSPSDEITQPYHMIERVEEGHFEQGKWIFERVWNGDQSDWGLNFTSTHTLLKVKMAAYQP